MTDDDEKRVALLDAALEAMAAAEKACDAAGVPMLYSAIREERAHVIARARDIAIGDEVRIRDGRHEYTERLRAIGRSYIHTDRGRYNIETGGDGGNGYGRNIHPDDLARINRCFPRGSTTKKAPRLG